MDVMVVLVAISVVVGDVPFFRLMVSFDVLSFLSPALSPPPSRLLYDVIELFHVSLLFWLAFVYFLHRHCQRLPQRSVCILYAFQLTFLVLLQLRCVSVFNRFYYILLFRTHTLTM